VCVCVCVCVRVDCGPPRAREQAQVAYSASSMNVCLTASSVLYRHLFSSFSFFFPQRGCLLPASCRPRAESTQPPPPLSSFSYHPLSTQPLPPPPQDKEAKKSREAMDARLAAQELKSREEGGGKSGEGEFAAAA